MVEAAFETTAHLADHHHEQTKDLLRQNVLEDEEAGPGPAKNIHCRHRAAIEG
ncbi:MAG: hypothetical protein ACRDR6_16495 [Pseudonocardiaceae bacterium]